MKFLIAEDDEFLSKAYEAKLKKDGDEFRLAKDGEEVITILETFTPDVILLDLIMPKKDGFVVLEEIKKDPMYKDIPVVVTSNLSQKEDVDRCMALGAKNFLVKADYGLNEIIEVVKNSIRA